MLPASRALARNLPIQSRSAYVCRACLQQQRRNASTPSSQLPPAKPPTDDARSQILLQQLQEANRAIPDYPQAKSKDTRATSAQTAYDGPIHPQVMGFAAGAMVAAGGMYLWYHFSGAARSVNHNSEVHKRLTDDRMKHFITPGRQVPGAVSGTSEDRFLWFQRSAYFYAIYCPGADVYADIVVPDIVKARFQEGEKLDLKLDPIIRDCALELQGLIKGGDMGKSVGDAAWFIMHKHLELAAEAIDGLRELPEGVRESVKRRIDALVKAGSKIGRRERRAMEDDEMRRTA